MTDQELFRQWLEASPLYKEAVQVLEELHFSENNCTFEIPFEKFNNDRKMLDVMCFQIPMVIRHKFGLDFCGCLCYPRKKIVLFRNIEKGFLVEVASEDLHQYLPKLSAVFQLLGSAGEILIIPSADPRGTLSVIYVAHPEQIIVDQVKHFLKEAGLYPQVGRTIKEVMYEFSEALANFIFFSKEVIT